MLFNSFEFLFGFLPLALLGFFVLGRLPVALPAISFLGIASLIFYAWWNPIYLLLLGASIVFNYFIGYHLSSKHVADSSNRWLLCFGITANLCLLGWYKYATFIASSTNAAFGTHWPVPTILLPLGISFFTFTQIAYLVDAWRKEVREYRFTHYLLFVTFFPHLIAGPVLHHAEIMPQFAHLRTRRASAENFAIGITIFSIGLFKKVILADNFSGFSTPVFSAAQAGQTLTLYAAWGGALAYTFQLYFDFSGYSDMAIGLARLFGVTFPANFNSPYKATSIIDFWRCWHMTLSRFLRDYLYIPLGGGRCGPLRRQVNLMATMLLGGLWHGAGWTFVLWGGLHGLYLVTNHLWRNAVHRPPIRLPAPLATWSGRLLTFTIVVIAWVFFRAESLDAALAIIKGMAGLNGAVRHDPNYFGSRELKWLIAAFIIVWMLPNVQQIFHKHNPALETYPGEISPPRLPLLAWQPSHSWAFASAVLLVLALINLSHVSEFLYFQF